MARHVSNHERNGFGPELERDVIVAIRTVPGTPFAVPEHGKSRRCLRRPSVMDTPYSIRRALYETGAPKFQWFPCCLVELVWTVNLPSTDELFGHDLDPVAPRGLFFFLT